MSLPLKVGAVQMNERPSMMEIGVVPHQVSSTFVCADAVVDVQCGRDE
jgi:hypothetical protein